MTAAAKKVPALPGPYSVAEAINRIDVVFASQIGYREGRSTSGSWNNDTIFGVAYGMNFNAWCAMFMTWGAVAAGPAYTKIIPKHAYTPTGFNWFSSRGLADGRKPPNKIGRAATGQGRPRRGDLMYVYNASMGRISHVGFVENVLPGGYIQTVEGNTDPGGSAQGNGVYRLKRQVTSRLYFVHPNYAAVVIARPTPTPTGPKPAKPGAPAVKPPATDRFGQPRTGGSPKLDSARKQVLDLAVLAAGAKHKGVPTYTMWTQVAAAGRSLKALGLMPRTDAYTGQNFRNAWARWQKSLGYKGADADGIPGTASFSRFIERTGRSKKSPGYKAK